MEKEREEERERGRENRQRDRESAYRLRNRLVRTLAPIGERINTR